MNMARRLSLDPAPSPVSVMDPTPRPVVQASLTGQPGEAGWMMVPNPHQAFIIDGPEVSGLARTYEILRHRHSGERFDILRLGEADKNQPLVTIGIWRRGHQGAPALPANALESFAAGDSSGPQLAGASIPLTTKFGALPQRHAYYVRQGGTARRCLTFEWRAPDRATAMLGWWCSADSAKVDRARLACTLDRLTLMSAGGDADFARTFAHVELHRQFCNPAQPATTAGLPPPDWMDGDTGLPFAQPHPKQAQAPLRSAVD